MSYVLVPSVLLLCMAFHTSKSEQPCLCYTGVEKAVYSQPDTDSEPVGYMYEFDCRPKAMEVADVDGFYTLQYAHQLGYIETDPQLFDDVCQDSVIADNQITTTREGQTMMTTTPTSVPSTTPFTRWQHAANVSGLVFENIGIGYNLLDGSPTDSPDPGVLLQKRILQLTGVRNKVDEPSLYQNSTCTVQSLETLVHGSLSLQQELEHFTKPSDAHSDTVLQASFTYGSDFWESRKYIDSGSLVYIDHITTCTLTTVVYRTESELQRPYTISRDFATDVCNLPLRLDNTTETTYFRFIDVWGTSIVMSADLGWRNLTRYETTRPRMFNTIQKTNPALISHGGPSEGYASSLILDIQAFANSSVSPEVLGDIKDSGKIGSKADQVVVGLDIVPITEYIDWTHFEAVLQLLVSENECPDSVSEADIQTLHDNLNTALEEYVDYRNAQTGYIHSHPVKDHPVQIPVTWPLGTYGLPKSAAGCPGNNVQWMHGWLEQDTDDVNMNNTFYPNIQRYLAGNFGNDTIRTEYCMRNRSVETAYDMDWPAGTYCVLEKGECPTGFGRGYIFWDDETSRNGNRHTQLLEALPDGTYDENTRMYFCCRNDSSPDTEITLPSGWPFVLLRFGEQCQSVYGMSVRDLYVDWTTDNDENKDSTGGVHPYDDGTPQHHRLHFCYYTDYIDSGVHLVG